MFFAFSSLYIHIIIMYFVSLLHINFPYKIYIACFFIYLVCYMIQLLNKMLFNCHCEACSLLVSGTPLISHIMSRGQQEREAEMTEVISFCNVCIVMATINGLYCKREIPQCEGQCLWLSNDSSIGAGAWAEGDRKFPSGRHHLHQSQHFHCKCKGTISSQRQLGQLKNSTYSNIPFCMPLYGEIYTCKNTPKHFKVQLLCKVLL